MRRLVIRRAEAHDAEGIARVCAAGWSNTYRGIKEPDRIEAVIAEYYTPERISREIAAPEGWDGWMVAVENDTVIGAGGGGMTEPGVGEIFVLYLDPPRRGEGIGTLLLDAITEQQRVQGAREQWVSVEPENTKGLPFYYAPWLRGTRAAARMGHCARGRPCFSPAHASSPLTPTPSSSTSSFSWEV
jgi:GNAT superfamily N-acetyltransferase